jgi:HK97 family phage prohead protease
MSDSEVAEFRAAFEAWRASASEDNLTRREATNPPVNVDVENRTVTFLVSNAMLDSHGSIVQQDWDLERYRRNPVVLYRHNKGSGFLGNLTQKETLPIGFSLDVSQAPEGLVAVVKFATEKASELAEYVFNGLVEGTIRATSVGFRSSNERYELHDGKEVLVLSGNELYEISIVPIPSNSWAIGRELANSGRKATERGKMDENTQRELADARAQITGLEGELSVAREQLTRAATETAQAKDAAARFEARLADLQTVITERDAAIVGLRAQVEVAETETAERDVDALLGKKFGPVERSFMLSDRKTYGAKAFAERMAARPDLHLVDTVTSAKRETVKDQSTETPAERMARMLGEGNR